MRATNVVSAMMGVMHAETLATPMLFSWDENTDVPLLPRMDGEVLVVTKETLIKQKPKVLINILPSLWQLEPLLSDTCKEAKVPLVSVQQENVPLALKMHEILAADAVIGTQASLKDFFEHREKSKAKAAVACVILVAQLEEVLAPPIHDNLFIERHLVPGRACLYQCEHLVPSVSEYHSVKEFEFTLSENHIEISDRTASISSQKVSIRLKKSKHSCPCGEPILEYT